MCIDLKKEKREGEKERMERENEREGIQWSESTWREASDRRRRNWAKFQKLKGAQFYHGLEVCYAGKDLE